MLIGAGHIGVGGAAGLVLGGIDAVIVTALYPSVHVREHTRTTPMDPFLRGGYARWLGLTDSGGTNSLTLGGGFNYWMSDNRAWVAEFRAVRPTGLIGSR